MQKLEFKTKKHHMKVEGRLFERGRRPAGRRTGNNSEAR
jgi:hypothetical protein